MNDIDESIVVALRDRADGGVRVEDLLAGARHRGQRRRLVRRTAAAAGAGAMALAVIGAVAVLPRNSGTPAPGVAADRSVVTVPAGRPPVAEGAPALGQGGIAGKDGLFHLDHTGSEETYATWESGSGWELMRAGTPPVAPDQFGLDYVAAIGVSAADLNTALAETGDELTKNPTTTELTIGKKPATFVWSGMRPADGARWGYIRWQPVAGTWALVFSSFAADPGTNGDTDLAQLLEFVGQVRFDRVYRCAVNFRTTWVPSKTTATSCEFVGGDQPWARVSLSSGAATYSVDVGMAEATAAKPVRPNTTYAGQPMEYTDAGRVRRVVGDRVVTLDPANGTLAKNDALRLAAGIQPVTAPEPAEWPADPMR